MTLAPSNASPGYPVFLSVVLPVRNRSELLEPTLRRLVDMLTPLVTDYELIVIDNASSDDSLQVLERLASHDGIPNVQVYALAAQVDEDTAAWAGVESALGDYVVVADIVDDDVGFIPVMLERAVGGAELVFATNAQPPAASAVYSMAFSLFDRLYRRLGGISIAQEAPSFRMISRKVVNFVLQHKMPVTTYRFLAAAGGFARANLTYSMPRPTAPHKRLRGAVGRAARLLVSTTHAPMRLVSMLCLIGAGANILYSMYVIAVAILKSDVAPGWVTISLVQSGMFFLISLVLFVLGEYVIYMAAQTSGGPLYYVGREFNSVRITRRERLNVDDAQQPVQPFASASDRAASDAGHG